MTMELSNIGIGLLCLDIEPLDVAEPVLREMAESQGCTLKTVVVWRKADSLWTFGVLSAVHTNAASTIFARDHAHLGDFLRAMVGVADVVVGSTLPSTYAYVGYEAYVPRPGLVAVPEARARRRIA